MAPTREHYLGLKNSCCYLHATRDWGIVFWRKNALLDLPNIPLSPPADLAPPDGFPSYGLQDLTGFVDAAHANDPKTMRSVTGFGFSFAGGVVAYKTKLQPTVATSSTESEFIAAVLAAKTGKYLRSVLHELGFAQTQPTVLYIDNKAAIDMINVNRPTPRSRHIDIQYFAIQEWRASGLILVRHIPGILNSADQATKALGWTLHARHARRLMGHFGPPVPTLYAHG